MSWDVALVGVDEWDWGIRVRLKAEAEQSGHLRIGLEGVEPQAWDGGARKEWFKGRTIQRQIGR